MVVDRRKERQTESGTGIGGDGRCSPTPTGLSVQHRKCQKTMKTIDVLRRGRAAPAAEQFRSTCITCGTRGTSLSRTAYSKCLHTGATKTDNQDCLAM